MQGQNTCFYLNIFNYPYSLYAPVYHQIPQDFNFYAQVPASEQLPFIQSTASPLQNAATAKQPSKIKIEHRKPKKPQRPSIYYESDESSYEMQKVKRKRSKTKVRNSLYYCEDLYKKNATSNILRNFFRNVIELKLYGNFIKRILLKLGILCQIQEFYDWINSYNISSKKFINRATVFKILAKSEREDFRKVLSIVLYRFMNEESICCILTSKRYLFKKNQLFGLRVLMKKIAALNQKTKR